MCDCILIQALRRLDHLVTLGFLTRKQRRTYPVYSLTEAGRIGNKILNSDADYVPFMMGYGGFFCMTRFF